MKITVFWDVMPCCVAGVSSSTLKMEAVGFSETMVTIYQAIRHNITENRNLHSYCHENLKSNIKYVQYKLYRT
jgi:hypothetical protein